MGRSIFLIAFFLLLATFRADAAESVAAAAPAASSGTIDYQLGTGDKLRIIVFGEMDLSGEYVVDGGGFIRLPLVGEVKAAGSSLAEFERQIVAVLREGYLLDPRVSVEVMNFRPFYIIGEVMMPGQYPYASEMSVLNAVAMAGGYTYRANQSRVFIRRNGDTEEQAAPADQTTKIGPGDIIRVSERFF